MLLQFKLVYAAETILGQEPLNGLNHIQLGLNKRKEIMTNIRHNVNLCRDNLLQ